MLYLAHPRPNQKPHGIPTGLHARVFEAPSSPQPEKGGRGASPSGQPTFPPVLASLSPSTSPAARRPLPQIRDARPQASPPGRTWPPSCTVQAIASHHHSCVPTARAPPHRPSSKPPLLAILRPTRGDTYLGAADDVDRRLLPHARAAQVTGDPRASRRGGWARPTLCTETDRGS